MTGSARTIAIGDIHGCLAALEAILQAIEPQPADTLITLGDYVDRGPDSRGVIDRLIHLGSVCQLVPLLGNHDESFLEAIQGLEIHFWIAMGGAATLASYRELTGKGHIPDGHITFLRSCPTFFETETHIFIHASYDPELPMNEQFRETLLWASLRNAIPGPHSSGKTVLTGHTAQKTGEILDLGHLKCIDTWCYGEGWLTALDVVSGQIWQADREGRLRDEI
jgi:serine/threonine protein phosphatase 1